MHGHYSWSRGSPGSYSPSANSQLTVWSVCMGGHMWAKSDEILTREVFEKQGSMEQTIKQLNKRQKILGYLLAVVMQAIG